MKVTIATCFESNEERAAYVYETCIRRGYEVKVFTSDFSHIRKEKRKSVPAPFSVVSARPYKRNLSLARMLSHSVFSKDLFSEIEKENPDLIWLMAPANSLIREAKKYKKIHPKTKLIIDIIDMWPESLPFQMNKNIFPLNLWKGIRKNNIDCADYLVTECDLYQDILKKEYHDRIRTIHWARKRNTVIKKTDLNDSQLTLCYIGSINHIIDIDRIARLISSLKVPVNLHLIGEGESTDSFIDIVGKTCNLIYHGPIRDEEKKAEIFRQCYAGINVYKEGLYIGLTVKCIDYFENGLPIINNIKGDTWKLVEDYRAGINIASNNSVDPKILMNMRHDNWNIYQLFEENFSIDIFIQKCQQVIDEVFQ